MFCFLSHARHKLQADSALLLGTPSLHKAQPNTTAHFMGCAFGIIHMAQLAHEEELTRITGATVVEEK